MIRIGSIVLRVWQPAVNDEAVAKRITLAQVVGWYWHFMGGLWIVLFVLLALALVLPAFALLWWVDTSRVRRRAALAGFAVCACALVGVALAFPDEEWETFVRGGHVSKFARSGVTMTFELTTRGYMESDAAITERLKTLPETACTPSAKPPVFQPISATISRPVLRTEVSIAGRSSGSKVRRSMISASTPVSAAAASATCTMLP